MAARPVGLALLCQCREPLAKATRPLGRLALPPAPDGRSAAALHEAHQPRHETEAPRAYPDPLSVPRVLLPQLLRLPLPELAIYARFMELLG